MNIDKIVKEAIGNFLFSEGIIREGLGNYDGKLYHNTSLENLLSMMKENCIKSTKHRGFGYKVGEGDRNDSHDGICFTRNKNYNPYGQYCVQITFNTNAISKYARGLKLVPYHDAEYENLDEYEERLISKDGKPFVLTNLNNMVSKVCIKLDSLCQDIHASSNGYEPYVELLEKIFSNNIFGERLMITSSGNGNESISLETAIDYIEKDFNEGNENEKDVYVVECYDEEQETFNVDSYYSLDDIQEAIECAKGIYAEEGIPTRVVQGILYSDYSFETERVIKTFGDF